MFISFQKLGTSTGFTSSSFQICILYRHLLKPVKIWECVKPVLNANFAKNRQIFGTVLQLFWCTMQAKSDVFKHQNLKEINHDTELFPAIASNYLKTISELNEQNFLWYNAGKRQPKTNSFMCRVPINGCKLRHHGLLKNSKSL